VNQVVPNSTSDRPPEKKRLLLFDADYDMPETNGDRVASPIKKIRHRLPIIMLSGAIDIPKKLLRSIDGFIAKGEPAALLGKIQHLLA